MDVDFNSLPSPQHYTDISSSQEQAESSLNFDYLQALNEGRTDTDMDASASASSSSTYNDMAGKYEDARGSAENDANTTGINYGHVDYSKAIDKPFNLNERFVTVLDQLDARVEKFRKDAIGLQDKKDFLLMSIDLIKSNDLLHNMNESDREEISYYIQRVNSRLATVELNVRTVRDCAQEDSLSQINALIDMMITLGDPVMSRQRCQKYLNTCCSFADTGDTHRMVCVAESHYAEVLSGRGGQGVDMDGGAIDKQFENVLLGCTLDDQKNIKKRLQALMDYLNKQIVHN